MKRRNLLLGLALTVCPNLALSAQRPSRKEVKHFDWTYPGVRPYTGSDEQAFTLLASGGLIPPHVLAELRERVRNNAGDLEDTISDGDRFTLMVFGKGTRMPNVVARAIQWPSGATRAIIRYEYRFKERVYVLLRPSVCGNWALRVLTIQGECIACIECTQDDPECEEIRLEQAALQQRRRS